MSQKQSQDMQRQIAFLPDGWISGDRLAQRGMDSGGNLYSTSCASPTSSLRAFAMVNLLTLAGSFVLGRATVRHRLACGLLPKPNLEESLSRRFLRLSLLIPAIVMVVLELTSAIVGAFIVYESGLLTRQALIMMSLARPRGTWVTIVIFYITGSVLKCLGVIKEKGIWIRKYKSSHLAMIVTEVVLEIIGIIPTVHLLVTIAKNNRRSDIATLDPYTMVMNVGAIVYVIGISVSTSLFITAIVFWIQPQLASAEFPENGEQERLQKSNRRGKLIWWCTFALGWIPALGSWMIWTGFVHVAKNFYCSKKVLEIAIVWIACTLMRTFVGAG